MNTRTELLITFAIAIGIDAVLLLLGARLLAKIRLPFGTALWTSFIACILTSIIAAGFAFFLVDHLGLAMILAIAIGFFIQAIVFQISIRATGQTLSASKAYILSLLVILTNFFVVSPIVALIVGSFSR
jgi:hypothetical protein